MVLTTFTQYVGEKNSFPRKYNTSHNVNINGTFRGECDILNPVLYIDKAAVANLPLSIEWYNYVNIVQFLRGYFIENIVIDPSGIYIVSLHVDVLGTYSSKILNSKAFINRNENDYNEMIIDKKMELEPAEQYEVVELTAGTPFRSFRTSPNLSVVIGFGSIIPNQNGEGGD